MKTHQFLALLPLLAVIAGCAATGPGGDLNEVATIAELEAKVEAMEKKVARALKQSAAAKIDASTALFLSQSLSDKMEELEEN